MLVLGEAAAKSLQQHRAACVERPEGKGALTRHQFQRRIDEADVPAAIAPWILVAAGKDSTPVGIEPFEQGR